MHYPFTAIVGQHQLKTALLLNAVNPGIGGVLIRGEKGTAKSTAARGLAEVLPAIRVVDGCPFNCDPTGPWAGCPHCSTLNDPPAAATDAPVPFVDLPLGATEDRVLGTLDFEQALHEGRRAVQPGLLASAHRGILYVDEVNLLSDHLVDVLLDAAAMGVNTVQREGIEVIHPSRFILIGTMNPEEGELRPQLLDRFGLMVDVAGPQDHELRSEVVRRRIAFDDDPAGFATEWANEQTALRERILAARARLSTVTLNDGLLTLISRLCCEVGVEGLRADIVMHKTARTLATLDGRSDVTTGDVREAAELVLPHRRRRQPFEQPGLDQQQLDDLLGNSHSQSNGQRDQETRGGEETEQGGVGDDEPERTDAEQTPDEKTINGSPDEGHEQEDRQAPIVNRQSEVFAPAASQQSARIQVEASEPTPRSGRGRRNSAPSANRGRYIRAIADESPIDPAIDATLRSAAQRGTDEQGRPRITRADLRQKQRMGRAGSLILFVVDASGSMGARRRMEAVKGAVLDLLLDAYQQRDQVGVIAFRGPEAEVLLPPTGSVELAEQALRTLPTGGRTPLAHALVLAEKTLRRHTRNDEHLPLLILLSDGKANVPLAGTPYEQGDPWTQTLQAAGVLAETETPALVIDTEAGYVRMGRVEKIAAAIGAEYVRLDTLSSDSLVMTVRKHVIRDA